MECSIHKDKQSEVSCVNCGKGMCIECDELTGHTGLCPSCIVKLSDALIVKLKKQIREDKTYIFFVEGIFVVIATVFITLACVYTNYLMLIALVPCILFAIFTLLYVRKNYVKRKNNLKIIKDRLKKCQQITETNVVE